MPNSIAPLAAALCLTLTSTAFAADALPPAAPPRPGLPDVEMPSGTGVSGAGLPRGVPRTVLPDGSVYIEPSFTTRAFQKEALRLVIEEANTVARELNLPEKLPITTSNVVHGFVGPFGYSFMEKRIGNITTKIYSYGAEQGNKFSDLTIANYDGHGFEYRDKYQWPVSRIDTNAAYQLATQWLAAAHMDVEALNRDCRVQCKVDETFNGLKPGEQPHGTFAPIYWVHWLPRSNQPGSVAYVTLFAPTKTLLQLTVYDPKYILRKPLVFTNLAALFPATNAPIVVMTNWPTPQYLSAPGPN